MTRNTLKSNNLSRRNNENYRVMKILLTMCFILIYNFLEAKSLFRYIWIHKVFSSCILMRMEDQYDISNEILPLCCKICFKDFNLEMASCIPVKHIITGV